MKKGESLRDTVQTIEAMGIDAVVIRHPAAGAPHRVAIVDRRQRDQRGRRLPRAPHAGAARRAHAAPPPRRRPRRRAHRDRRRHPATRGSPRSDAPAFATLGADVTLVAPPTLLPSSLEGWPVHGEPRPRRRAPRRSTSCTCCASSSSASRTRRCSRALREYTARYGLTVERAARLRKDALVMHPGPMNRGVEIAAEVAEGPASLITEQVTNGVAVRMAVLYTLLGQEVRALSDGGARRSAAGASSTRPVSASPTCSCAAAHVVEVGADLAGDETLDASGCVVTPGLVDLHVHLREPGDGGGRDDRDRHPRRGARRVHRGRRDAEHRRPRSTIPRSSRRCSPPGERRRSCDGGVVGLHHPVAAPASSSRRWASSTTLGVRIFTDDGVVRRRRRRDAPRARVLAGAARARSSRSTPKTPPSPAAARCTKARGRAGSASPAGRRRPRRHRRPRRDPRRAHRRARALPPRLDRRRGRPRARRRRRAASRSPPRRAPHHFTLTDECCASFDPMFKVHPPLRTDADVAAIKRGLADGTIDAIATDHAPHTRRGEGAPVRGGAAGHARARDRARAHAHRAGRARRAHARRRARRSCPGARPRSPASSTTGGRSRPARSPTSACSTPPSRWEVDAQRLASKARNTPFAGRTLTGKVRHTVLRGQPVVIDGEAQR